VEIVGRETEALLQIQLKIGLAVAIDVAFDVRNRALDHDAKLACIVVEVVVKDVPEVLIAVAMGVGVDCSEVDEVAAKSGLKVEDLVVMLALADLGNGIEDEGVLGVVGVAAACTAVQDIRAETADDDVGTCASVYLAKLSELMFIEVVRRHLETLPPEQAGWFAGLRDPFVGKALSRMHAKPEHTWTIEDLAKDVGLSRSVLAQRFTDLVGLPPMQYLAKWRMQIAAGLLSRGANIATIAAEIGYGSEAAFSRAFKKVVGMPPSEWRRSRNN